jgi:3-methylfumaryl-CoA hydratase
MSEWDAWIGRVDARADQVDPALVRRWCATLDRDVPDGGAAPQGLHWCLAVPDAPTAALGEDGHPRRDDGPGSFLPPVPLPRRMWASSTVRFHAALPIGATILRTSRVAAITTKQGGSGTLVFVDIAHDTHHGDTLLVSELQSVVYRAAAPTGAVAVPPPCGPARFDAARWTLVRTVEPAPPLLFRYSALTFNSHRIHYDLPYARDEEGYRGLIVHGPLIASLLLDLARRHVGDNRLATFRFRGLSPAVAGEPLHLALREEAGELVLGAFARDGRQVTDASAGLSSPWPALSG